MELQMLQKLNIKNLAYDTAYFAKRVKSMQVKEALDYVTVNTGLPTFNFNIITLMHPTLNVLQEDVLPEINTFNEQKLPITIWCYGHDTQANHMLEKIGLQEYKTTYLAMVAHLNAMKKDTLLPPNHLSIKQVSTAEELHEFSRVLSTLYNDPLEKKSIQKYYQQIAPAYLATTSDKKLYIGMIDDKVVSIGALTYKNQTIGMYHIATLKNYRGKGLATEMVHYLLTEAQQSEASYCTLQSSPAGKKIYEKAGFFPIGILKGFENLHLIS